MSTKPLQIVFHDLTPSEAVEAAVRRHCAHLERFAGDIMSCRVVVAQAQKHQHQGRPFTVTIALTLPGRELVANREANEDVYVALRDAFDDMKRQLEDAVRRRRGDEKAHPQPLHGEVARLEAGQGFGFIRTPDGQEFYFGPDNLASGRFEDLQPGMPVQFIAAWAAEGPQAQRVSLGKHQVALGKGQGS